MKTKSIDLVPNLKRLMSLAAVVGICAGLPTDALADAHCYCHLSCYDQTGNMSVGSSLKNYGWLATYTGAGQQNEAHQQQCQASCKAAAAPDIGSQALATAACAMGCPNGTVVRAYSAAGNKPYREASGSTPIGTLINTPPVTNTTYSCPAGTWLDSPSQGNGQHARCIKNSCNAATGVPAAPSWVSIGTSWSTATGPAWVTDNQGNIWYGVPARGTVTVIKPAECRWQ